MGDYPGLCSVQSLSRVWLCDPMNCSTPGLPVHHQLLEFTQTHVHRVGDAIQTSHPPSSPSPPAPNPSQHQGLFQWVNSLHEVAKVLEFQLQHLFQWTPRTDLLEDGLVGSWALNLMTNTLMRERQREIKYTQKMTMWPWGVHGAPGKGI